jgi:hypothetical protein
MYDYAHTPAHGRIDDGEEFAAQRRGRSEQRPFEASDRGAVPRAKGKPKRNVLPAEVWINASLETAA